MSREAKTLQAPHTPPVETETAVVAAAVKAVSEAINSPAILAARHAIVTLLGGIAKIRHSAAKLNEQASTEYKAVNVSVLAQHLAIIATEVFTAQPKYRTAARLWAKAWNWQLTQMAIETFEESEGAEGASDLRSRFGSDCSKFGLVFFYCPATLPAWVGGLYGVQPESSPTLGQAYLIAQMLKRLASPRSDDALAKLWASTAKKFGKVEEMRRFLAIVTRDVAAREAASKEASAPTIQSAPQEAVA
jgi:hypothetical protein